MKFPVSASAAWLVRTAGRSYAVVAAILASIALVNAFARHPLTAAICTSGAIVFAINAVLARGVLKRYA